MQPRLDRENIGILFDSSVLSEAVKNLHSAYFVSEEKRFDAIKTSLTTIASEKQIELNRLKSELYQLHRTYFLNISEEKEKASLDLILASTKTRILNLLSEINQTKAQTLKDVTNFEDKLQEIYVAQEANFTNLKKLKIELAKTLKGEIEDRRQRALDTENNDDLNKNIDNFNWKFKGVAHYNRESQVCTYESFLNNEFSNLRLSEIEKLVNNILIQCNKRPDGSKSNSSKNFKAVFGALQSLIASGSDYLQFLNGGQAFVLTDSGFKWSQTAYHLESEVSVQANKVAALVSEYSSKAAVTNLASHVNLVRESVERLKKTVALNKIKNAQLKKLYEIRKFFEALGLDCTLEGRAKDADDSIRKLVSSLSDRKIEEIESLVFTENGLDDMEKGMKLHVTVASSAYELLAALQHSDKSYQATTLSTSYKDFVTDTLNSHKQLVESLVKLPAVLEEKNRPAMTVFLEQVIQLTAKVEKIQAIELCRLLIQTISNTAYWHEQLAFSSLRDEKKMPTGIQQMLNSINSLKKNYGDDWFESHTVAKEFIDQIIASADARLKYHCCGFFSPRRTAAVGDFYKFLVDLRSNLGVLQLNAATFKTAKDVKAIAKIIAPQEVLVSASYVTTAA